MKMSELKAGDKALIISVQAEGEVAQRLLDMGLVPGTPFKVIRKAPLGDPIEIKLRGFMMALRIKEAACIIVEKTGEIGDGIPMGRRRGRRNGWR
ncbi:MAG: ferrous iron transport protein A [Spirochaetes bacterium]|nr:ferrous iron transport protein A [Spirochaetota bacterium]